jgi:aspartate kinase
MEGILVSGATVQKELAKITMVGVDNKPGNAARVFEYLAAAKVVVNDIIQTEVSPEKANMSFTVGKSDLLTAKETIDKIRTQVKCDSVFIREDIAEVSIVGVGMRSHYGVANKMFKALADLKVNIEAITTSEIRISCLVDIKDALKAYETVCDAFELDKAAEKRTQPK